MNEPSMNEPSMTEPSMNEPSMTEPSMNGLRQLTTLDPMRDFEPTPERRARATAALDELFQQREERVAPRRRLVAGAVAAAGVALAAVLLVPGGNGAYASWTPTPRAIAGADVLPQARQCAAGWGSEWRTPPTAADVLLAERRGIATMLLVRRDGTDLTSCFVLDPERGAAGADLLDTSGPGPQPGRVGIESLGASEGSEGWYSDAIGRAGAGVSRVEVELPGGTKVRASLRDGWWAAWWPGHEGGEADGVRVIVHAVGGVRGFRPSEL